MHRDSAESSYVADTELLQQLAATPDYPLVFAARFSDAHCPS